MAEKLDKPVQMGLVQIMAESQGGNFITWKKEIFRQVSKIFWIPALFS